MVAQVEKASPYLLVGEPPDYAALVCPTDPTHDGFCEYAYVATSQPFIRPGKHEEPNWDTFDYGEHHPHLILCQECEATVWEAKAPTPPCGDDHNLAVWLTPDAVRQHLEGHDASDDCGDRVALLTDAELAEAAGYFVTDLDTVWRNYDYWCDEILGVAEELAKKRATVAPSTTGG